MNQTVLITGASSGIGYELSKIFAMNGYDLVLVSRTKSPGPTHTKFGERAKMKNAKILNGPWVMNAKDVAEIAYSGLMKRKRIIIPGYINNFKVSSTASHRQQRLDRSAFAARQRNFNYTIGKLGIGPGPGMSSSLWAWSYGQVYSATYPFPFHWSSST